LIIFLSNFLFEIFLHPFEIYQRIFLRCENYFLCADVLRFFGLKFGAACCLFARIKLIWPVFHVKFFGFLKVFLSFFE